MENNLVKNILGLDLGITSIGWAFVKESDDYSISSSIERIGVRIIHYGDNMVKVDKNGKVTPSAKPWEDFAAGKGVSPNAGRTKDRSLRRNLQRYKQRRENLIDALLKAGIITSETILAEHENDSTHATYRLRSKAATEEIPLEAFARVLLMINKKRGYKSSRKAKNPEEGQDIDGMAIAKQLYEKVLTPGQFSYRLLKEGKKTLPEYYRSDLNAELDKIWQTQQKAHPEIFTDAFRKEIEGKSKKSTAATFWGKYGFNTTENKGTREEKKLRAYEWRSKAVNEPLSKEEAAYVIAEINGDINSSSGYLGATSDRSKELYFNKQTVGQYLYAQLKANPHARLKNQVFYRQDYLDEFEGIWEMQAKHNKDLTPALKEEIRDIIIFYQRKLKSQKGLVSFCEFESREIEIPRDGKLVKKTIGYRVAPKSSPLFQEFKIWQNLNHLETQNKETKERISFAVEAKQALFNELNVKGNLPKDVVLRMLVKKPKDWDLNFATLEGNRTAKALYEAFLKMMGAEGYDSEAFCKLKNDNDEFDLTTTLLSATEIQQMVSDWLTAQGINPQILHFNAELDGKAFEQQPAYQLWHLLYSYQEDTSPSGNETLYGLLNKKFGFTEAQAKVLAIVPFSDDYGSLSAKAMRKIFPFVKEHKYSEACALAGYNHSSSLTKEEIEARPLNESGKLELLKKNSLRNPVVEKILNQMVNVINTLVNTYSERDKDGNIAQPFHFDEIRIELARELKKNAKERAEMTQSINKANAEHDRIRQILIKEDGIANPTRNDIIRYKLYQELKNNGYKTLYSNTYVPREKLFSKEFDIEHILPKALIFDDSFSNKTLCVRQENLDKGNRCAREFIGPYFGEDKVEEYLKRVEDLYQKGLKSPEEGISKAKYKKLLMKADEIGSGFIERDLRDSQYIAKKAKQMLHGICRHVVSTTGSITDRLREDWGLVNVMQELNLEKYRKLGLTEMVRKKDGGEKERILDWTKRNDHRHHAMDALTVAFTRRNHIQYLNYLNARKNEGHKMHGNVKAIEAKETDLVIDDEGKKKRKFKSPIPNFREEAKRHLGQVLVSYKAKNKVVTKNKNKFKTKAGEKSKVELTPRGQLHKETVYGSLVRYAVKEEKVGAKFDEQTIARVATQRYRHVLLQRLQEHGGDPKKAFTGNNSLDKMPLYWDKEGQHKVPEKVKLISWEKEYTIRKDITPDNFKEAKNIEKVVDTGIRKILLQRLKDCNGNAKEAFSNLDKNPIWLNEEKGVAIKRVTISGVQNAEPLHVKKDHLGKAILDENGQPQPVDFVSTGNNHHIAIYRDADGNLQEEAISFYEAVARVNAGQPIINKKHNEAIGWQFLFTMKQNEYFLFPSESFQPNEVDLLNPANAPIISPHLFRVQKIATKNYFFRHHLETNIEEPKALKGITYKPQLGLNAIDGVVKVRLNHIGQIVKVGEY